MKRSEMEGCAGPFGFRFKDVAKRGARLDMEFPQPAAQQGAEPSPTTPEQFAALIRSEIPKYARIVKESGAKVD